MIRIKRELMPVLIAAFVLILATGYAQDTNVTRGDQIQADTLKVPAGQKMHIEGVIVAQENDNLTLRGSGGGLYKVVLTGAELKEKKNNPFRGAKTYSRTDLVQGLQIDVKGTGDSMG